MTPQQHEELIFQLKKNGETLNDILKNEIGWKASYSNELIQTTAYVQADGATNIVFRNIGDDNATIDGNIPCNVGEDDLIFVNKPGVKISGKFKVMFAGSGTAPKILVIKTYYDK